MRRREKAGRDDTLEWVASSAVGKSYLYDMRISQVVTSSADLKYPKRVYAFTEQGATMLSSVLNSPRAIHVNRIPIFQRTYSWERGHCEQRWSDSVCVGGKREQCGWGLAVVGRTPDSRPATPGR